MFENASNIISDASKLDYDYVPENLTDREGQMSSLEVLFRPLAQHGRSCTAFLTGSVGTGKTVTAKRFCRDMSDYCRDRGRPIEVLFINCRNRNSEAAVILQMIRFFDPGYPDRGFSVEEMARVLRNHLMDNNRSMVIVLDEVDVLIRKGTVDIVYQLTRFSDGAEHSARVSLILISQEPVYDYMDEASVSSFRRSNVVRFDRYTREELLRIVTARAQEALYPGRITDDALALIADNSADYGDARMAIELLDRAANIAEGDDRGEVDVEHVRAAKAMIYSTVSESKLVSLDVNRKVSLLAVARAIKTNLNINMSAAEKTYAVVCEEYGVAARKHTQFWTYIQDLEKAGFLRTVVRNDGNGRTTLISLPDIPSKVLAAKMEAILDREMSREVDPDEM